MGKQPREVLGAVGLVLLLWDAELCGGQRSCARSARVATMLPALLLLETALPNQNTAFSQLLG